MNYMTDRKRKLVDDMFTRMSGASVEGMMRTDIRRKDDMFYLDIELPGYTKEDVRISLFSGTLTVTAAHTAENEEKDSRGNLLRKERFTGRLERSWNVGTAIRDTDIKASMHDGILTISVPSEERKEKEEKRFIEIL